MPWLCQKRLSVIRCSGWQQRQYSYSNGNRNWELGTRESADQEPPEAGAASCHVIEFSAIMSGKPQRNICRDWGNATWRLNGCSSSSGGNPPLINLLFSGGPTSIRQVRELRFQNRICPIPSSLGFSVALNGREIPGLRVPNLSDSHWNFPHHNLCNFHLKSSEQGIW